MAAMAKYSGNLRQLAVRMPTAMWRLTSSSSTVNAGDSKKQAVPDPTSVPKEEAEDISTYKVKEYFSYNEWSFYDIENDIDASGRRQTQPDPKVKYIHTNPWTTNEKAAA